MLGDGFSDEFEINNQSSRFYFSNKSDLSQRAIFGGLILEKLFSKSKSGRKE
jgi:hypothetical protein